MLKQFRQLIPILVYIGSLLGGLFYLKLDLELIKQKLEILPAMTVQLKDHETRITRVETLIEVKKQ